MYINLRVFGCMQDTFARATLGYLVYKVFGKRIVFWSLSFQLFLPPKERKYSIHTVTEFHFHSHRIFFQSFHIYMIDLLLLLRSHGNMYIVFRFYDD